MTQPSSSPFSLMAKPTGAICNLDCEYCYFLKKERLYPDSDFRMSDEVLESFVRQHIAAQPGDEVHFHWQGGEPTLMGIDFFRRAVELQKKHGGDRRVQNAIQTNGVSLDDEWCRFLAEHGFLVGISIDGPPELHDAYRRDKGGGPTSAKVERGVSRLKEHGVEFNVLTTVHRRNANYGVEVYRYLRDQIGASFIQFIPIVERTDPEGRQRGRSLTGRSVNGKEYGKFLIDVFEEWVRRDVGEVYVQIFDVALAAWVGERPGLCIFEETCGGALALEHTGDVYSCDHYVEPDYRLGNLLQQPLVDLVEKPAQQDFGQAKKRDLPQKCVECPVRFVCNGGCPKNRVLTTDSGQEGLNALCDGYLAFFTHIDDAMKFMAGELRADRAPARVMQHMESKDIAEGRRPLGAPALAQPCPCGSGRPFSACHGSGAT